MKSRCKKKNTRWNAWCVLYSCVICTFCNYVERKVGSFQMRKVLGSLGKKRTDVSSVPKTIRNVKRQPIDFTVFLEMRIPSYAHEAHARQLMFPTVASSSVCLLHIDFGS